MQHEVGQAQTAQQQLPECALNPLSDAFNTFCGTSASATHCALCRLMLRKVEYSAHGPRSHEWKYPRIHFKTFQAQK